MGVRFTYRIEPEIMERVGWSYSGFGAVRKELAALIGIDLMSMEGFARHGGTPWSAVAPDPIHSLINHSDCDGDIPPSECKTAAPRLRYLATKLNDEYDRDMCLALADMMDECVRHHVPLEFR